MGYRIEYGCAIPQQYIKHTSRARLKTMTAAFLLLFSILVHRFYPEGTEKLQQFLLPDTLTVTQNAVDLLMGDLRDGQRLDDAFTAFCSYIIAHDETIPH